MYETRTVELQARKTPTARLLSASSWSVSGDFAEVDHVELHSGASATH
jgi:hypothetical protein